MWYMPSYGRPERLRELLEAPGGWPEKVVVLVNLDDPEHEHYFHVLDALKAKWTLDLLDQGEGGKAQYGIPWRLASIASGSRCADAHRAITMRWPDEPFYGLLCDDQWPITPSWDKALIEAAGDRYIATPAGEPLFPKLRNALVLGGELVRAMGSLVPAPVKHNYEDNIWDQIAEDFGILRPLPDVIVEHRHWIRGDATKDKTYERGSSDIDTDRRIFEAWMASPERAALRSRLALLFGATASAINPSEIRLGIVSPIQGEVVDVLYHKSLNATLIELSAAGFKLNVIETSGGSHVGKARERCLWEMWRKKPTHILMIDNDMGWDVKAVTRLLCSDHEFSAVAGRRKKDETSFCFNPLPDGQFDEKTHFLEVRDVGGAFIMLKASVIEKMCAAYPELRYNAGDREEYALFLDMIDKSDTSNGPHGERLSEDFSFCRRWRAIGGNIWLDTQSPLTHAGRKEYTGRVADILEQK